ncbi:E3 ubiquitin-protein ligase TRIM21 [Erinaceus europaeus]|uniref:E3 ubiquitin-protein ligase TRIM21 n=1 Tax=Erinaceus europaeus TaxID=9365 RepID=A0A1S3A0U6_ERIEU|nr:E3 ubiquitin-protein ligase TRIM21 [Erinaceus europaeus]
MASAMPLAKMWEEVTCPVCLYPMEEPVSIECGHNFCKGCISEIGKAGGSNCPMCRVPFLLRNLRPNLQLGNMVANLKQMGQDAAGSPEGDAQGQRCEVHGEKALLFCEEDGLALCWVCHQSRKHRHHSMVPIEEAAQEYQEKLLDALEELSKKQQLAEMLQADVAMKREDWKREVEGRKEKIHAEFLKQGDTMTKEEQKHLQELEKQEKEHLRALGQAEASLAQQLQALLELKSEVERRIRASALELLLEVKIILERCASWKLENPEIVPPKLTVIQLPGVEKRLRAFGVHVTLDPHTANRWLIVSKDRRQVRLGIFPQKVPESQERFEEFPMVLGAQYFNSGKWYWEVDVTGKYAWDLGVCRDSVKRRGSFTLSPKNGFWTIWLWNGIYAVGTSPQKTLSLLEPPRQVGIFLDIEARTVSFYSITKCSSLIYSFSGCAFTDLVRPFFNAGFNDSGRNAAPLTLCPLAKTPAAS